jgi:hypothetical protein
MEAGLEVLVLWLRTFVSFAISNHGDGHITALYPTVIGGKNGGP